MNAFSRGNCSTIFPSVGRHASNPEKLLAGSKFREGRAVGPQLYRLKSKTDKLAGCRFGLLGQIRLLKRGEVKIYNLFANGSGLLSRCHNAVDVDLNFNFWIFPVGHMSSLVQPTGDRKPPQGAWQIGRSDSGRRKGAGINGLLVGDSAVQFDKIDQHHPVRRLTVVFGLGKKGALVG
jgi:hypothetical protein